MRFPFGHLALLATLAIVPPAIAADSSETMVTYLDRYHRLSETDFNGRLALAEWCGRQGLLQQKVDLLTEALKLRPDDSTVYFDLIESDLKRTRPVDRQWAEKLQGLMDSRFYLHHTPHFTLLTDADKTSAAELAEAMEESYRTFYKELPAIGLNPMPPAGRLVCVLVEGYDDYRDFLRKFEGTDAGWTSGFYSWRTNRVLFFNDRDNPVFKDVRDRMAIVEHDIAEMRTQMDRLGASETAKRLSLQDKLKRATAELNDMTWRLGAAGKLSTLIKTRHEATHQLFFNSNIQRRGRYYPFWLAEGLANCFEVCDKQGNAGPRFVNTYRLGTYRHVQQEGELLSLQRLLTERPGNDEDAMRVAGKYAQNWAFVHFLWNRHPADFARYMKEVDAAGDRADHTALLIERFGDLQDLEREFRKYIDGLSN